MTKSKIRATIREAHRFIKAAKAAIETSQYPESDTLMGSKESGKCRRASMDLTRALAEMRR